MRLLVVNLTLTLIVDSRWRAGGQGLARIEDRLQVGGALEHDARDARRHDQRVDPPDRAPRHLPRDRDRPARAGEHELPALADPRLPGRDGGADGEPRPARRHVRARADVQPRLRRLHGLLDPPLADLDAGHDGGALADPDAGRPGSRRCAPLRELERDPHRCLPEEPARARARGQQHRRDRRLVHRARARRGARAGELACGVPRLGAGRRDRDDLVVPLAARARRAAARRRSTGGATRPSRSASSG